MYNPRDWYWIVGGTGPHLEPGKRHPPYRRVYSSKMGVYVETSDPNYTEWLERQRTLSGMEHPATRIAAESDLVEVLRAHDVEFGKAA